MRVLSDVLDELAERPRPPAAGRRRRLPPGLGRWAAILAAVIVAVLAATAPLPVHVERPAQLVGAEEVVEMTPRPDSAEGAVSGTYLTASTSHGATAVQLLGAAAGGEVAVGAALGPPLVEGIDVLHYAAMSGYGVAPSRVAPADAPVTVTLTSPAPGGPAVVPQSLGVMLAAFDVAAPLDLGRGRRILALGTVGADGMIRCAQAPDRSVAAAGQVDVVLTGAGCPLSAPRSVTGEVVESASFLEAVTALAR